jgi:hypothetical protein
LAIYAVGLCSSLALSFQPLPVSNSDQTCFSFTRQADSTEIRTNVRNNSNSFDRAVVAGTRDVIHDGWIHSHPFRVVGGDGVDTNNTGPTDRLKRHEWLRIQARYDPLIRQDAERYCSDSCPRCQQDRTGAKQSL